MLAYMNKEAYEESLRTGRVVRVARLLDEWAMLDVLALALAIVHVKLEELATTHLLPGFWAVYAAGALTMLDAWLVRRHAVRRGHQV